jgi:excisionase family DNA binding protein
MTQGTDRRPGLLTADEVGRLLDIDASTVYRMAGDGRLPAVKIGRQWRFPAERIARLLEPVTAPTLPPASAPTPGAPIRPDAAQPVVDVAAELLGVMMVVTDMTGRPLTAVANPCPAFEARATDADLITTCTIEWRALAEDLDFEPRFRSGALGFECARAFVRRGPELVGMVLAGGVATEGDTSPGLYALDPDQRRQVLAALPKVAATLSRVASADAPQPTDARSTR